MPRIEELRLEAYGVDTTKLFALKMPKLRSLIMHHIHELPLEILAKNESLENLGTLQMYPQLHFDSEEDWAILHLDHIKALGESKSLRSLKRLQFQFSKMGDSGVKEIIKTAYWEG